MKPEVKPDIRLESALGLWLKAELYGKPHYNELSFSTGRIPESDQAPKPKPCPASFALVSAFLKRYASVTSATVKLSAGPRLVAYRTIISTGTEPSKAEVYRIVLELVL